MFVGRNNLRSLSLNRHSQLLLLLFSTGDGEIARSIENNKDTSYRARTGTQPRMKTNIKDNP